MLGVTGHVQASISFIQAHLERTNQLVGSREHLLVHSAKCWIEHHDSVEPLIRCQDVIVAAFDQVGRHAHGVLESQTRWFLLWLAELSRSRLWLAKLSRSRLWWAKLSRSRLWLAELSRFLLRLAELSWFLAAIGWTESIPAVIGWIERLPDFRVLCCKQQILRSPAGSHWDIEGCCLGSSNLIAWETVPSGLNSLIVFASPLVARMFPRADTDRVTRESVVTTHFITSHFLPALAFRHPENLENICIIAHVYDVIQHKDVPGLPHSRQGDSLLTCKGFLMEDSDCVGILLSDEDVLIVHGYPDDPRPDLNFLAQHGRRFEHLWYSTVDWK